MQEFEKIKVTHSQAIELIVENPTDLKLIGKGAHGAVFRLSEDKCVKLYADTDVAKMEADAYRRAQHSDIIPKLYDSGVNYVILEYVDGMSLLEFLTEKKEIPINTSRQLISLFREMQRIGFTRLDSSLRHIIIAPDGFLKVVDIVYSYHLSDAIPRRALIDLEECSLLLPFLQHLKEIDRQLYDRWQTGRAS